MNEGFLEEINLKLSQATDVINMLIEGASPDVPTMYYVGILNFLMRDLDNTIFEIEEYSKTMYNKKSDVKDEGN